MPKSKTIKRWLASHGAMDSHLQFLLRSLRARLWIKPLGYALFAVGIVLCAGLSDSFEVGELLPQIDQKTVDKLLEVISTSMLGVATFAVASMVGAYASASSSATPRAFSLIIADGMSQKALSTFIGAFIFSVVSTVALEIKYFGPTGRFVLFVLTLVVVAWVIVVFVRWVDRIARLGRMRNTIERIADAASRALATWGKTRSLKATPVPHARAVGEEISTSKVGYVQHIDIPALESFAAEHDAVINVHVTPGMFVSPAMALAYVEWADGRPRDADAGEIADMFVLSETRTFRQDPRFGLVAMAEIASRALSPGVNDPGTAIEILARYVQIIAEWKADVLDGDLHDRFHRVRVPVLRYDDVIDDAFHAIARDGAGCVEVAAWVQKALGAICELDEPGLTEAARHQADLALRRAEQALSFPDDIARVREASARFLGTADG